VTSEVNFYHLTRSSLEDALPRLLTKTLQAGARAVVLLGSTERVDALNTHLWTYDPNGFLPHGSARDGDAARQPVWLTHLDENPNGATFLFVADHARSDRIGDYKRCFEIFDGRDETAVGEARERWKTYKAAGHTVIYWQQTQTGSWEKKA
jgi:DNA polymerase III subunit chi